MNATVVAAGLIRRDGKVLLCKRPDGKPLEGGKWEFPGGKLEKGETPQAALARELEEELAVAVCVDRLRDAELRDYGDKTVLILFYDCRIVRGEPAALEHSRIEFVPFDRLLSYDLADADRRAAQTILSEKEKTDA